MQRDNESPAPSYEIVPQEHVHDALHGLAIRDPIQSDRHPVAVYLARLAPGSRRVMKTALHTMAGELTGGRCDAHTLDWSQLRYQHTAAVRAIVSEKYAPATANKFLSALRGVLQEAWRLGWIAAEDYHRAADLPTVRGASLPRGRALSVGELRHLFGACARDKGPGGVRDAAILAVLYGAGLRRSELVSLDLTDYNPETRELRVRRGKGKKARQCWAPHGCVLALNRWIELRDIEAGPLFCPVNKSRRIQLRRMTDQAVLYVLQRRADQAGVPAFSPHDLRRTFIGDLLEAGADIATVQQLAGHANVQTTARYDRRGEATKRRAVELLHVPYTEQDGT